MSLPNGKAHVWNRIFNQGHSQVACLFQLVEEEGPGPPPYPGHLIQCSTAQALSMACMLGFPRHVVVTQMGSG